MSTVNNFIFIDEIENNFNNDPVIHYFCVAVIERELSHMENQVKKITDLLGKRGFHAKRNYKNITVSKELMATMNDLIIDNKLFCFCFSFRKSYLENPRLKVFKDFVTNDWDIDFSKYWGEELVKKITSTSNWKLKVDNYRQVATMILFHCLNTFLAKKGLLKKYRLIFDEDVIKSNQIIIPEPNGVLSNIDTIYGASMNDAPILCLPDHIGYIFGKSMIAKRIIDGKVLEKPMPKATLINACVSNFVDLFNRGQFVYKDVWDLIKNQS